MRIGFIGLGNMGGPMAMNLVRAGHDLTVNDLRRELADPHLAAGANWADSVRAVAEASEIVFTSLPGPPEVEAVALGPEGILESAAAGSVYIDLSSNRPTLIREIHARFAERGIEVLDAPVSGGITGAAAGTLAVMVGGDAERYEELKPVLDSIGDKVSYIGGIGSGMVAKLVHNMTSISSRMAIAEGMTLAAKAGVDPHVMQRVLQDGAFGQGHFLNHRLVDTVFAQHWDPPSFALRLSRKDLGLATELARELGVPMAHAALSEQEMLAALGRGWGELDSNIFFRLQEERAGVELGGESDAGDAGSSG